MKQRVCDHSRLFFFPSTCKYSVHISAYSKSATHQSGMLTAVPAAIEPEPTNDQLGVCDPIPAVRTFSHLLGIVHDIRI